MVCVLALGQLVAALSWVVVAPQLLVEIHKMVVVEIHKMVVVEIHNKVVVRHRRQA